MPEQDLNRGDGHVSANAAATGTHILGLSPDQIAEVEGALADATSSGSGAYLRLLLSQTQNAPIPPGTEVHTARLTWAV